MSRVLASHVDLDGCFVFILERAFRDKLGFDGLMMLDYGFEKDEELMSQLSSYDEIIMTDLSLPEEKFLELRRSGKMITVYDHHDSAKYLDDYRGNVHDETRSGTSIFYDEYVRPRVKRVPGVVPQAVKLVETYDMWKDDDPLWEPALSLNRVLYSFIDYDIKGLAAYEKFFKVETRKIVEGWDDWGWTDPESMAIEKARESEDRRFHEAVDTIQLRTDNHGAMFGVFSLPGKISIVAARVLKDDRYRFLDYVVIVNSYGGINGNISVRSRNGFMCPDLGPVNGHPAAAGGVITKEEAQAFLKEDRCLTYKADEAFSLNGVLTDACKDNAS